MEMKGTEAVVFAIEATRTAITVLASQKVAQFTFKWSGHTDRSWKSTGLKQRLTELNKKARASWKSFDLCDNRGESWEDPSDLTYRWFFLDVLLLSGTEVHAEWKISKKNNVWQGGVGRVEINDDASVRSGRPYEVKVEKMNDKIVPISAQRYTDFGTMGTPTSAPPILF